MLCSPAMKAMLAPLNTAGITEGALYRHYESKEELAWLLFSDHYIQLARKLEQLQAAEPTFRGKVDALIGRLTACGAGCAADRTVVIVKSACSAVVGSASTLLQ